MNDNRLIKDNLFSILNSLFSGNEIIYVSTPINTGERFIKWYNSIGKNLTENSVEYKKEITKNVVEPNVKNAKECIKKIRKLTRKTIIDPTTLENGKTINWSQDEFYQFWDKVMQELVNEIVLLDGWEYSVGCCHELLSALENGIEIYSQDMKVMSISEVIIRMNKSIGLYNTYNINAKKDINEMLRKIQKYNDKKFENSFMSNKANILKDEKLDFLISSGIANIAQFISFEPSSNLIPKFVHINNLGNYNNFTTKEVVEKLILSSPSKSVNIRSFSPEIMKGNILVFNKKIEDIEGILNIIKENLLMGKNSIINENISINDSGVSGVALGDIIEFSPEDTPKCVDKEGVCSLPREIALKVLKNVYGFSPELNFDHNYRIEFSIHPSRQGVKKQHTIIWEYEYYEKINIERKISWPNRFSSFIGDKVFGLLIADSLGIMVPKTTVVSRKVAPFSFGIETGLIEKWIRTCPIKKEPGKYYTGMNWTDPFKLMDIEEMKGSNDTNIASIISQDAVEAVYSGASFVTANKNNDLIEGVLGKGDKFMVGEQDKENLPPEVIEAVIELNNQLRMYYKELGDVSIEWVYDGINVWLVQLNQLKVCVNNKSDTQIIVNGNPTHYEKVFVKDGLDTLRHIIDLYKNKNIGIELIGNIGITSHFGDLLRLSNIPSILTKVYEF